MLNLSCFCLCTGSVEIAAVGVSIAIINQVSKVAIFPLVNITTSFVAEEDTVRRLSAESDENQKCEQDVEKGSVKKCHNVIIEQTAEEEKDAAAAKLDNSDSLYKDNDGKKLQEKQNGMPESQQFFFFFFLSRDYLKTNNLCNISYRNQQLSRRKETHSISINFIACRGNTWSLANNTPYISCQTNSWIHGCQICGSSIQTYLHISIYLDFLEIPLHKNPCF